MNTLHSFILVGSICLLGAASAQAKPGGKNIEFRKKLCNQKNEHRSYALPNQKLNPRIKIISVQWHPDDYKVNETKIWERGNKKEGGVCAMKVSVPNKGVHTVFHDGCSGEWPKIKMPSNKKGAKTWGQMFHPACVRHDHCYHHEPTLSQQSQKDCDKQMLTGMQNICDKQFKDSRSGFRKCKRAAKGMHAALRLAGKKHYNFMNSKVPYTDLYEKR